ncbi:MAG TPA: BON domain-containing protein [Steroidobacteraceae bacterium]|nr:BON domain-containing protein [Steroidobacteraceae bacterium]
MLKQQFRNVSLVAVILAVSACAATRTREAPGEAVDDSVVTTRVKTALIGDKMTKAHQIAVDTRRGVVQLSGFVDSANERDEAVRVARKINGVREVQDNLKISPGATVGEVIDDSTITAKVKVALAADPITKAYQINVDTKDGVVLLSGFVDNGDEQRQATVVAQGVHGVKRVDNQTDIKR